MHFPNKKELEGSLGLQGLRLKVQRGYLVVMVGPRATPKILGRPQTTKHWLNTNELDKWRLSKYDAMYTGRRAKIRREWEVQKADTPKEELGCFSCNGHVRSKQGANTRLVDKIRKWVINVLQNLQNYAHMGKIAQIEDEAECLLCMRNCSKHQARITHTHTHTIKFCSTELTF